MVSPTTIQNRYQIIRLLGTGGFARVYLAHDQRLGREVAIKELLSTKLDGAERQQALALFEREAHMLARLDHHGLTQIWDYFQSDDQAYLVMEYVPGPTLRELVVRHGGPLPVSSVLAYGMQLCDVLGYLHSHTPPIIFRDLKPSNVIAEDIAGDTDSGDVASLKLIDFGIARLFNPDQSADTLVIGTPGYAAPEQYGHGQTDQRSDIYSLGATLHHLACGQPPTGFILPPLLQVNPAASPAVARVIARATAIKPSDRYQTVKAIQQDLHAIAQGSTRAGAATSYATRPLVPRALPKTPAPSIAGSPILVVAAMIVLVALVAGGFVIANALATNTGGSAARPLSATPRSAPTNIAGAATLPLPGVRGTLIYSQYSENDQASGIFRIDTASQSRQRLVSGDNNTAADLSPDGRMLAVVRNYVLTVGPLNNPTQRQISITGRFARYPAFSPDGQLLAYTESNAENGAYRLAIFNLQTGAIQYPGPNRLGWLTWSPIGLTYAGQPTPGQPQDLFLLSNQDAAPQNLTNTPNVEEDFPAWSADQQSLFFTASVPGDLDSRQIHSMNADGSERRQLTQDYGPHTNPAPSPDGNWVTYVSRSSGSRFQLWSMRVDGSEPRQLISGEAIQFYLRWKA